MPKTIKLIGYGITPVLVGFLMNRLILRLPISGMVVRLLTALLLLLWGYFAFRISNTDQSPVLQAFFMCAFGLFMLALVLYQELVVGAYWPNFVGFASQMYFLPCLSFASLIVSPLMDVVRVWPMYIVTFIAMFIVSYLGAVNKARG